MRFEEVALGYKYQAGEPEDCAISHHNLANYLERQGADPATVLAHRLAAAAIRLQMQSGLLSTTVRNLAISDLPPAPPAFADVVKRVEAIEGVRFRALFERPAPYRPRRRRRPRRRLADGGGREETPGRREAETRPDAGLGPCGRPAAFELEGDEFNAALREALAEMPEAEAAALVQRLGEAGLISQLAGPDMTQVLQQFEPLLQGIAAAVKDEGLRAEIEPVTRRKGKQKGWRLTEAVHRIWAGERDVEALTAGIDGNSAQLVRRVLELLDQ